MTIVDGAERYRVLSVVRDGDGYVLGSPHCRDFVAVPDIGGRVVHWLQEGCGVEECARRAAALAGEPVDVAGFLAGLTAAGLLPPDGAAAAPSGADPPDAAPAPVSQRRRAAGRLAFGPVGLAVQGLLAVAGAAILVAVPRTRPTYADAIVGHVPLISLVVVLLLGTVLGLAHEVAHVLAAWAIGVPSRISVGRRMVTLVFQTDLTRLWSVPRRNRAVPLLAGVLFDAATVGALVLAEWATPLGSPVRTVVFLNLSAVAFQFLIFLRTDVYALFVVVTGCRNLWGTKGALVRRAVRRDTAEDRALLAAAGRREVFWARVFVFLYLPGAGWTAWYVVSYLVPATARIVAMAVHAIGSAGPASLTGAAGVIALAVTAASTGYILYGLGRTAARWRRPTRPAGPS